MIAHVTVSTAQLPETLEFYQWLLQLPLARKLQTPRGEIVFLGENETKLELVEDAAAEKIQAKGLTIGFAVASLEEKIALLDSRQIPHSDIISPLPGVKFAFFRDLNGCEIQLCEDALNEHVGAIS